MASEGDENSIPFQAEMKLHYEILSLYRIF